MYSDTNFIIYPSHSVQLQDMVKFESVGTSLNMESTNYLKIKKYRYRYKINLNKGQNYSYSLRISPSAPLALWDTCHKKSCSRSHSLHKS